MAVDNLPKVSTNGSPQLSAAPSSQPMSPERSWTLARLLWPLSVEEFALSHYGSRFLTLEGDRLRFENLFGWDDLKQVLDRLAFCGSYSSVQIVKHTTVKIEPKSLDEMRENISAEHTFVVKRLEQHHEGVLALARGLRRDIGERIGCNLYVSSAEVQGLARHYDDHDVFVLQLEGEKRWRLYGATQPFPSSHAVRLARNVPLDRPPDEIERELVLSPGDVLYLPGGVWHEALALGSRSMHLTVSINRRTGRDFASWLLDELENEEMFRRPRPLVPRRDGQASPQAFRAWLAEVGAVMAALCRNEEVVERYHRHCTRHEPPPEFPPFSQASDTPSVPTS